MQWIMNMYAQHSFLTFPVNPGRTGEEHMWSLLQPISPSHWNNQTGQRKHIHSQVDGRHCWSLLLQLLLYCIYSSTRTTLIILPLLNANDSQQAVSCLCLYYFPWDLFCIRLYKDVYHSIFHGLLEIGGLLRCHYLKRLINMWKLWL